ncbi:MAG TPA: DUF4129 domain-containing protein [Flavisolibacter sp.]
MHKILKHTRSLAALCLLLFLSLAAPAQDDEEEEKDIFNQPTIVEVPQEDSDTSMFEQITYNSRQPLETRKVPPSDVNRLKDDDAFWYANVAREKKKEKRSSPSFSESVGNKAWFKVLVWLLIGGAFITIIILFLSSSNISLFRKKQAAAEKKEEEGEFGEDIFSMDHEREIRRAEEQGDLRRAIRYLYLRTLKDLAHKDLIHYRHESTDSDYLRQLSQTGYYRDFGRLTRHFQYAWYGKFSVAPPLYKMIGEDFANFKKRLGA